MTHELKTTRFLRQPQAHGAAHGRARDLGYHTAALRTYHEARRGGAAPGPRRPGLRPWEARSSLRERQHVRPHQRGLGYLATVADVGSRRIVGFALANRMPDDLVIEAIEAALGTRGSLAGAVLHTDRASQYLSRKVRSLLATLGVRQSAGRVATCYDNAVAESFFATLKRELVHNQRFGGLGEARRAIDAWIQRYNTVRLHSARGDSNLLEQRESLNSRLLTLKVADDATMVAVLRVGPNFVKQGCENSLIRRVAIC